MNWEKLESDVKKIMESLGFVAIRCRNSRPADLVCLKEGLPPIFVECKYGSATISKKQAEKLLELARRAGGILLLVYRKRYRRTRFCLVLPDGLIPLDDLSCFLQTLKDGGVQSIRPIARRASLLT